jgi:septal ring factor EnvC (AmiA/AmiB activator)
VFETPLRGHAVVLSHADGQISILEGLGELRVAAGQAVRRGETLGLLPPAQGSTAAPGSATISLEIWRGQLPVNPATVLGR